MCNLPKWSKFVERKILVDISNSLTKEQVNLKGLISMVMASVMQEMEDVDSVAYAEHKSYRESKTFVASPYTFD